ncbi:hypothetical protein G6F70_003098 [Rhizopus microsporus]|nr:hypothetical protein G6F71_003152 [Rhizopus microsporus]KAG1201510.1 hypothetical protein G6F70_003098 [Rhizopus microsporus]KAG1213473.1 hypothetical protein G6F69_002797 [Rhizopus microsporus]KAG1235465.1 hypothetical protein G6F67_002753 [Rhizopus microsporus]KAG1267497.1 hypothetical protein G6F68_001873 [Rhizopus microsporus]
MTPAEAIRNQYYLSQQGQLSSNQNVPDKIQLPRQEPQMTLYEPQSDQEPKIVLEHNNNNNNNNSASEFQKSSDHIIRRNSSKLLLKLSKSTAPMRAKLSTLSPSKSQLDQLWASSSSTLTRPIRKSAESSFSFEQKVPNTISCAYPALLSNIAEAFKESIIVGTRVKDNIIYHDVFDGKDAVDKLCSILRTSDRELAILIGRALNHQKYFHDVNYEHKLRDSDKELYQFKELNGIPTPTKRKITNRKATKDERRNAGLPNGVFTLWTRCYSPTCSIDNICYSTSCPTNNRKGSSPIRDSKIKVERSISQNSLNVEKREDRLWQYAVPKSVLNNLSLKERNRQENIFELIYTEQDFVNDLAYVEESWIFALKNSDCIQKDRRDQFIKDLFWNISQVRKTNQLLVQELSLYQSTHQVVDHIGHILLKHVKSFEPFVTYGAHQFISRHIFETEKSSNPAFAKFVENVEKLPESRKLELNGYLAKPTTRLGRYNLLLKEILKRTPEDNPDTAALPKPIPLALLTISLPEPNKRSSSIIPYTIGSSTDAIFLLPSYSTSSTGSNSHKTRFPLNFTHLGRHGSGTLTLYASTLASQRKWLDTIENHKRMIMEQTKAFNIENISHQFFNTFFKVNCAAAYNHFLFIGCDHGMYVKHLDNNEDDEHEGIKRVLHLNKVSQIDILNDLKIMLILADKTLYFCCLDTLIDGERLLTTIRLEQQKEANTTSNDVECSGNSQRLRKISSSVSFFKVGKVFDKTTSADKPVERTLICYVKYNAMTSTIRVLEPRSNTQDMKKKKISKGTGVFMRTSAADSLCLFKDLYIPGEATSIQFFKSVVCVGSAKGFQMVDIASAGVQSVLDPNDQSHQFIKQRETLRPLAMFKHPNGSILLCYNEKVEE